MHRLVLVALVALVALTATACAQADGDAATPTTADGADGLSVVATVYPFAWLAREIAPDAEVTSFAAGGQDLHDFELSPRDRQTLQSADVVVFLGDIGFQPQVEEAVAGAGGVTVAAADVVPADGLLPIAGHDDHDDHAADGDVDPHLWFDADLVAEVARATGEAFAAADPDGAEAYTAAASAVAADLESLADEVADLLSDCATDEVVVGHEAYAYLLEPHGLHQRGVSGAGGHQEASPQRIAELARLVREEGLRAVLSEPAAGRSDAGTVAAEAGVDVVEIASLDVVTDEQAAAGYPALLREQAAAVATAAGCGP